MDTCKTSECNNDIRAKGLCISCYMQIRRNGSANIRTTRCPNEIIMNNDYAEIILYNNKSEEIARAKINLEDVEK